MGDLQTITEQAARDARDVFESYGSKAREAIDYMEQLIYAAMRKTEPAADARAEALKAAAAIAQGYHDRAIAWAKTVRGLEQHIGETDSSRIASAILALIPEKQP